MARKQKSKKRDRSSQSQDASGFKPHVSPDEVLPELTPKVILLGILMSVVFGAANAYLGLKVGLTVSASIPAAVIGMGVLRGIFKQGSILETNMVQTIGSAGESLAAGVIFTVPAILILTREAGVKAKAMGVPPPPTPGAFKIFVIAAVGGLLGVLFMIPLRRFLIVKEHGKLPFPEGTACAEVQIAGQKGGNAAMSVFWGLTFGALYKLVMYLGTQGKMLSDHVSTMLPGIPKAQVGGALEASLLSVGFILGPGIGGQMLSGALVGWVVLIPLIAFLGAGNPSAVFPAGDPIAAMSAKAIWNNYIRYIGAGAVAFGGVLSLIKALPMIGATLSSGIFGGGSKARPVRTDEDLSGKTVLGSILVLAALVWFLPYFELSPAGVFCVVAFSFFFTTVSARIVGIVGSSSNPASGMTIATLLATALIFRFLGFSGLEGMTAAITVGSLVCIGICIGGDTSQDLKTGYLVGATPRLQQIGEVMGVIASAACIGGTIFLLDNAYTIGGDALPAPQANLMKLVVEGVMTGNLPWEFVFVGAGMGAAIECLGIGCLPFAVGLYLPFSLSSPIMLGGLLSWMFDVGLRNPAEKKAKKEKGVLLASGMIAGEATFGVFIAACVSFMQFLQGSSPETVTWIHETFWGWTKTDPSFAGLPHWHWPSLFVFGLLVLVFVDLYMSTRWKDEEGS